MKEINIIDRDYLKKIKTPTETKTWKPTPFIDVVDSVDLNIKNLGWVNNGSNLTWNKDETRLFGSTKIIVPSSDVKPNDYEFVLGYRVSHDKTMSLQFVVGISVIVCSNMSFSGQLKTRKEQTSNTSVEHEVLRALELFESSFAGINTNMDMLKDKTISYEQGISFLTNALKTRALALRDYIKAVDEFSLAYHGDSEVQIHYPRTLWSAYQAVTATWKSRSDIMLQPLSNKLNNLIKVGI